MYKPDKKQWDPIDTFDTVLEAAVAAALAKKARKAGIALPSPQKKSPRKGAHIAHSTQTCTSTITYHHHWRLIPCVLPIAGTAARPTLTESTENNSPLELEAQAESDMPNQRVPASAACPPAPTAATPSTTAAVATPLAPPLLLPSPQQLWPQLPPSGPLPPYALCPPPATDDDAGCGCETALCHKCGRNGPPGRKCLCGFQLTEWRWNTL